MNPISVVIFSSGISEHNGIVSYLRDGLEKNYHYNCLGWRDIFQTAMDESNIALLPMLVKKIPTFDYAILICEGHDKTYIQRDGEMIEANVMRDNVLFEIGLCTMALGPSKIILLTDGMTRLPEDLVGVNGELAIKQIQYDKDEIASYQASTEEIQRTILARSQSFDSLHQYIMSTSNHITPMMLGAANSIALGYARNFVYRLLENHSNGLYPLDGGPVIPINAAQFKLHIVIMHEFSGDNMARIQRRKQCLSRGKIPDRFHRDIMVDYEVQDSVLHIYDFPTTVSASYDIVNLILEINSDERNDDFARQRFLEKELKMFQDSLHRMLTVEFMTQLFRERTDDSQLEITHTIQSLSPLLSDCIVIETLI